MTKTKCFSARTCLLLEQQINEFIEQQPYFEYISSSVTTRGENMMALLIYEDTPYVEDCEPYEIT